jgi:hypothetical protein
MNWVLKMKIFEVYGTQADFAQGIKFDETLVSRVVRGRRQLKPPIQKVWADALKCRPKDLFSDARQNTK